MQYSHREKPADDVILDPLPSAEGACDETHLHVRRPRSLALQVPLSQNSSPCGYAPAHWTIVTRVVPHHNLVESELYYAGYPARLVLHFKLSLRITHFIYLFLLKLGKKKNTRKTKTKKKKKNRAAPQTPTTHTISAPLQYASVDVSRTNLQNRLLYKYMRQ